MDTKPLEDKIADLTVTLALRNDEIEDLKKQVKSFELLKQAIGAPGDVVNKARLFDEDVRTEGEISVAKIIKVLVSFTRKVENGVGRHPKDRFRGFNRGVKPASEATVDRDTSEEETSFRGEDTSSATT